MTEVTWWLWLAVALALLPVSMMALNLLLYRRLAAAEPGGNVPGVTVLIPARNEEQSIGAAVEAVLASRGIELELVVLDDGSTDGTARIVRQRAVADPRLRLETAPPLPPGWCGKQHACHVLAGHAHQPIMVFIDADVTLAPDALCRIASRMRRRGLDLLSGVPRQRTGTLLEKLLIPLIHTILLGYLPLVAARWVNHASLAAGCGQLMAVDRRSYHAVGGHSAIRSSLHDGLTLPRAFRRAGRATEVFDATDIAQCRMYHSASQVWEGLSKNAREGMATPVAIGPWTLLLGGGHVAAPLLGAALLMSGSPPAWPWALLLLAPWLMRFLQSAWFGQSWLSAALHPAGVLLLLAVQWSALWHDLRGMGPQWKGRRYPLST